MMTIGKYEVIGELGRGGMGIVYQVRHRELGVVFALKALHLSLIDETESVGRFYHEAKVMGRLQHPNIVKVFDIDKDENYHYFVMEYIQGRSLHEILEHEGPLPLAQVLDISKQVGQALAYAHSSQPTVVHRDIKPHNIMIEDGTGRVVVMDFGIAKLLGHQQTNYTRAGLFVGTFMYGAPEQLRGDVTIDGRADIFSFGMVLYEMATGHKFFAGMTREEIIGKQIIDPSEHTLSFEGRVPDAFSQVVAKAIAKNRDQRFATVNELLDALAKVDETAPTATNEPVRPTPPSDTPKVAEIAPAAASKPARPARSALFLLLPVAGIVAASLYFVIPARTPDTSLLTEAPPAAPQQTTPAPAGEPAQTAPMTPTAVMPTDTSKQPGSVPALGKVEVAPPKPEPKPAEPPAPSTQPAGILEPQEKPSATPPPVLGKVEAAPPPLEPKPAEPSTPPSAKPADTLEKRAKPPAAPPIPPKKTVTRQPPVKHSLIKPESAGKPARPASSGSKSTRCNDLLLRAQLDPDAQATYRKECTR